MGNRTRDGANAVDRVDASSWRSNNAGPQVPEIPQSLSKAAYATDDKGSNILVDQARQRLAAVVENSDDAIIAKDINGVVTDWNAGAERLFGYSADEAVGRPITLIIPPDRYDEETRILARLRRGEHIDHYETVRQRKDGTLVEISLSVSPIRNRAGRVIGASKIARDITSRRQADEQQRLLLAEMNHRIKNLFTLASSIVTLSARSAKSAEQLASTVTARLNALARANALTIPQISDSIDQQTTLHALIETIVAPYQSVLDERSRIQVTCCHAPIKGVAVIGFSLVINEFATNAAKYGALSAADGRVEINCAENEDRYVVQWTESGGPRVNLPISEDGFGSRLVRATVERQLCGEITREWAPEGVTIRLAIPADRIRAS